MPLKPIPPGKRGNKFWGMRGTPIAGGKRIEESTDQTTEEAALQYIALYEAKLIEQSDAKAIMTFGQVAERYKAEKSLDGLDEKRVDRLMVLLGEKPINEVNRSSLISVSEIVGGKWKNSTRNRAIIGPGAAILHYAADNEWRSDIRIKKFKTKKSPKRHTTIEVAISVIKNAPEGDEKLFLLWNYFCGDRITDSLEVECHDIDWGNASYRHYNSKNDTWRDAPIDKIVIDYAKKIKKYGQTTGRLFPRWKSRHSVYKWLTPLVKRLGVAYTPHMGRHSLGTWFKNEKANQKLIMDRLGHLDVESSMIYQGEDIEAVRKVTRSIFRKALKNQNLW